MIADMIKRHQKILGFVGGVIACFVAIVYLVVVPGEASATHGIQKLILLYGHSVCWMLLMGASVAWAITKNKLSTGFAYAALVVYIVFIGTFLITKAV